MKLEPQVYASDGHGIYVPQIFATSIKRECVTGVDAEDLDALASGPEHEHYDEAWCDVLDNAVVTDPTTGGVWRLYQDSDLFLIPDGMEWSDESNWFVWPDEEEESE